MFEPEKAKEKPKPNLLETEREIQRLRRKLASLKRVRDGVLQPYLQRVTEAVATVRGEDVELKALEREVLTRLLAVLEKM